MATTNPAPIIFNAPDMSIQVFHQTFHVNSTILKIHSDFFRTFLDSPDKTAASTSAAPKFKYEWVTEVDKDGTGWVLTAKEKSLPEARAREFKGDFKKSDHVQAFKTMLTAVNLQPITIKTVDQLCLVIELSDFYRMLPVMSTALHGVFYGNPELVSSIPKNCVSLLEASYKLRNKLLLRECFVHIMGPVSKPRYLALRNEDLKKLCMSAEQKLASQLNQLQLEIVKWEFKDSYWFGPQMSEMKKTMASAFLARGSNEIVQPYYYRHIFDKILPSSSTAGTTLQSKFKPILSNKLVLDRSGAQAGEGIYKDSFLCFELTDQELPWDDNQVVW